MTSKLQAAQPIVQPDGTMAYHFRDYMLIDVQNALDAVELAADAGSLVAVWGGISGTLSDQTDLQSELDGKADTSHTHAASDVTSGTFADARISESSVTQHQAALSVTESQISDLDKYSQAQVDALLVYYPPTVRDEATDPYTLVLADANKVLRFTTADADVTIPTNASVAFPVGTEISIRQAGTGTLVLTTTSLTINGTVPSWAQHVEVNFRKVASDTWDVV